MAARPQGRTGASRCRYENCRRPVFKQTKQYFDKRISRQVTTTFGSTCRFHYKQEVNENSRKSYDRRHTRVRWQSRCPKGHSYSGYNLIWYRGARKCRECARANARRYGSSEKGKQRRRNKYPRKPPVPATHCGKGHELIGYNALRQKDGKRIRTRCRICHNATTAASKRRRRAALRSENESGE